MKPHFYFEFTRRVGVPVVCALGMAVMLSTLVPPDALYASSIITTFVPDVAVRTQKGPQDQHVYNHFRSSTTSTGGSVYEEEDSVAKVRIYQEPGNQWRLDVTAKQDLKDVYFPYGSNAPALSTDLSGLIVYAPKGGGAFAEKAELLTGLQPDDSWGVYPGNFASPFLILANDVKGRIVAAVNWPPRLVAPLYTAARMTLHYHNYGQPTVKNGTTEVYNILVADVQPDPALYETPWQMGADQYKSWLTAHAPAPHYPDWMVKGNGFINLQLSGYKFSLQYLHQLVDPYKSMFNFVIMWGQMSPQGGDCCDFKQEIDLHYQPGLGQFTGELVSHGYHVAYYSRPYVKPNDWRKLDSPQGQEWFLGWIEKNGNFGANAFYLDTFGGVYWGSPPVVMNLMSSGAIPYDSVMEGYSDIYQRASLISGCLVGFGTCGGPERDPQRFDTTTFANLERYILNTRIVYEGPSDGDFRFWGTGKLWASDDSSLHGYNKLCHYADYCSQHGPCEDWNEVEAFLLGAKFDYAVDWNKKSSPDPQVFNRILSEWARVNWWSRNPAYMDTVGVDLSSIPKDSMVEVRRFEDSSQRNLFAVYNGRGIKGLRFRFKGRVFSVPTDKISVLE